MSEVEINPDSPEYLTWMKIAGYGNYKKMWLSRGRSGKFQAIFKRRHSACFKEDIEAKEKDALENFFGRDIEVPVCPLSEKDLKKWLNLGFEPHFLPKMQFSPERNFPGWHERPQAIFYEKIQQGKISKTAINLCGRWILIDNRPKPRKKVPWITCSNIISRGAEIFSFKPQNYFKRWAKQQYKDDFLLPVLERYGWKSRYACSIEDIERIKPEIAQNFGLKKEQIRLPYFVEYNFLSNLFYPEWRETDTWEWLEDKFGQDCHLCSGANSCSIIGWDPVSFWSTILGFRLVVVL